jgi:hypothetical protein
MECWCVLNVQAVTDHEPGMHNWLFAQMEALAGEVFHKMHGSCSLVSVRAKE